MYIFSYEKVIYFCDFVRFNYCSLFPLLYIRHFFRIIHNHSEKCEKFGVYFLLYKMIHLIGTVSQRLSLVSVKLDLWPATPILRLFLSSIYRLVPIRLYFDLRLLCFVKNTLLSPV